MSVLIPCVPLLRRQVDPSMADGYHAGPEGSRAEGSTTVRAATLAKDFPMANGTPLRLDTIVRQSSNQMSCQVDQEAVIMHLLTGRYFGCDPVGARVWALLEQPTSISALCERLMEEYSGVDRDRCAQDVIAFIRDLIDEGLVSAETVEQAIP